MAFGWLPPARTWRGSALAEHRLTRRGAFDDDAVELLERDEAERLGRAVSFRHLMAVTSQQRREDVAVVVRYTEHSLSLPISH
jgi:hypothetical protein